MDKMIVFETEKLLEMEKFRIRRSSNPELENDIVLYKVKVPSDFGYHFRSIAEYSFL